MIPFPLDKFGAFPKIRNLLTPMVRVNRSRSRDQNMELLHEKIVLQGRRQSSDFTTA